MQIEVEMDKVTQDKKTTNSTFLDKGVRCISLLTSRNPKLRYGNRNNTCEKVGIQNINIRVKKTPSEEIRRKSGVSTFINRIHTMN